MDPKRTMLSAVSALLLSAVTIVGASAQQTSAVNGDWLNSNGGDTGVPYYGYSRPHYAGRAIGYRRYNRLQMNAGPSTSSLNCDWLNSHGGDTGVPYYGYSRPHYTGRAIGFRRYNRLQMNAGPSTSSLNGDWLNSHGGDTGAPYYGYTRY